MYVFHCWSWDQKCSQPVKAVSSISDKIPGIPYTQWFTFVFWYFGGQWVKKLSGGAFLLFLLICRCFFPKIFYPIMYFVCMYKTKKICLHQFAFCIMIYSLKLPRQRGQIFSKNRFSELMFRSQNKNISQCQLKSLYRIHAGRCLW